MNKLRRDTKHHNETLTGDHPAPRRAADGSIDMDYYRRRARALRSRKAWEMLRQGCESLPFIARDEEDPPGALTSAVRPCTCD